MNYAGHFIHVCSCGNVITQCRCFHANKRRTIIAFGCEACKAQIALATSQATMLFVQSEDDDDAGSTR